MKVRIAILLAFLTSLAEAAIVTGPERGMLAPRVSAAAGQQWIPSIASSGTETVVAWFDSSPGREGIYVAAISQDGALIPGSQRWLAHAGANVAITWTGSRYLLAWNDSFGVTTAALDRELRVVVQPHVAVPRGTKTSNIRAIRNRAMLVYAEDGTHYAALLDADGNAVRLRIIIPSDIVVEPIVA
ncbi:MAG: hypothetical protein ACLGH0_13670, partial [Thermoanaerobaculia bacterium]